MSEELNVGSVAVSIVPDARGFDEKLQAQIRDVTAKVRLKLEDAAAKAGIAETTKDRTTKVGVKVEGADRAAADIDRVARDRTATIRVKADTKEAEAKISALKLLALPALSLGAPLVGSALGTGLGLGSVLGPAAGGLGLFGLIAKRGISQTNQDSQTLATLQNAVQTAKTAAARQAALKAYTAQYNSESPTQLAYINNERALSKSFNSFATSPAVFKPVSEAMKVMADVLPKLEPVIKAVGDSLTKALTSVDKMVQSGSFDKFINGFARLAGTSLDKILPALGNFFKGFVELEGAMSNTGLSFLDTFARAGKSFANWGANGGTQSFQNFVSYMKTEIPKVHQTLKDLGGALVDVFKALSPIGNVTLTVVDAFAKLIEQISGLGKFGQFAIEGAGLLFFLKQVKGLVDNVTTSAGKMGAKLSGVGANLVQDSGYHGLGYNETVQSAKGYAGSAFSSVGSRLQSKYGMAAGLGGAVLGIVTQESNNRAVNVLGGAASGALTGFSVGGPWGAAIGGMAGALIPLISAMDKSASKAQAATIDINAYANALDASGHANTDAARKAALDALRSAKDARGENAVAIAQSLGFTPKQIGDAGAGTDGGSLAKNVTSRLTDLQKQLAAAYGTAGSVGNASLTNTVNQAFASGNGAQVDPGGAGTAYAAYVKRIKAIYDERDALYTLLTALGASTTAMGNQSAATVQGIEVTQKFSDALKGLPAKATTDIVALGADDSVANVERVLAKYNATPAQVRTVLQALGEDDTIAHIQAVINAAKHVPATIPIKVTADAKQAVNVLSKIVPGLGGLVATVNRAMGGYIVGPGSGTSDSIPAMLSNGEYVVNARATAKHRRLLDAINAQHFAGGGPVLTPGQVAGLPSSVTGSKKKKRTTRTRVAHAIAPLTALQLQQAQHAFQLQEGMSDKAVTDKFFNFLMLLEKHGGHVTTAFNRLEKAALANEHQWTAVNDKLKVAQARIATDQSTAAGSFMGNIFAGSADYLRMELGSEVKNENAMTKAIALAKKHGLSGEFGAQLAGSGNLALAQQFSVMSPSEIKQIQALYAQRSAGSTALGNIAASFDQADVRALTKQMASLERGLAAISSKASTPLDDRLQRDANATITRGVIRVQAVGHTNLPMR
jgi:hypothetical protein